MTRMPLAILLLGLICATAYGETADEVAALQRQRDAAQARKDVATAEAEEAKAKLGNLDTSGLPKPTGESTGLNVEGKILAYGAVQSIASKIAARVASAVSAPASIAIYGEKEQRGVLQLRAYLVQSAEIRKVVNRAVRPDPSGTPTLPKLESDTLCGGVSTPKAAASAPDDEPGGGLPPLTAMSAVLQLLAIAKTDKKMAGADVTILDVALANAVAAKLLEKGFVVVYPATFASSLSFAKSASTPSKIIEESQRLASGSSALDLFVSLSTSRRQDLDSRSAKRKAGDPCKELFARDARVLGNNEMMAKALKTSIDQQTAALVQADDKTGLSPLQAMYESELLQARFGGQTKPPFILQITPVAAGGSTLTRTNFFATNFYFTGGAVISYSLSDGETGNIVAADTLSAYGGFVKAEDLPSQR